MPHQEITHRHQYAVLWPFSGYNEFGEPTVGEPVEIRVRWENQIQDGRDTKGYNVYIEALVHVDQVIDELSNMWLGRLSDFYGTGSAGYDTDIMQVYIYRETPDIKGRAIRRIVELIRLKDQPT